MKASTTSATTLLCMITVLLVPVLTNAINTVNHRNHHHTAAGVHAGVRGNAPGTAALADNARLATQKISNSTKGKKKHHDGGCKKSFEIITDNLGDAAGDQKSFTNLFHDANTNITLGKYQLTVSYIGDDEYDCNYQGTFLFDSDNVSESDTYITTILTLGSCRGSSAIIAGGTGDFACATGDMESDFLTDGSIAWDDTCAARVLVLTTTRNRKSTWIQY